MKKLIQIILCTVGAVFGLQQCYYDNVPEMYPGTQLPNTNVPDTVTYQTDIKPITDTKCAVSGCHNSVTQQNGLDLATFAHVKQIADNGKMRQRVIDHNPSPMPPGNPLPPDEIALIDKWLELGAPEN